MLSSAYNNTSDIIGGPSRQARTKLFTDYGFDPKGDNEGNAMFGRLLIGRYPGLASRVGFLNEQEPVIQAGIRNLQRMRSPANRQAQVDAYRRRAMANANQAASQGYNQLTRLGAGSGLAEGGALDAYNRAADATLSYDAYQNSPEAEMESLMGILEAYAAAENMGLEQWLAVNGLLEQNNQFRQSNRGSGSIFSGLGGALGSFLGGGFGKPKALPAPLPTL